MLGRTDGDRSEQDLARVLNLPTEEESGKNLIDLANKVDPIARYLTAYHAKKFIHPDGRIDDLTVPFSPAKAALIAHLCQQCEAELSIEIGFGMGSSATIFLGARRWVGKPFEHLIFDPYGLGAGRGEVVSSYLEEVFGRLFKRIWERSEVGLGQLLGTRGPGKAGLIFIDGGHKFESVMTDFVLSDLLCAVKGYIVLDDACFPAIETVVNYVRANRPDYAIAHLPVPNISVLQKLGPDTREWCSFRPFIVPDRRDWTSSSER